ncbi:MAG: hypothetical protein J6Q83_03045 [Clostridia bacterium]|nr:hypothetical protein [Clostridia bacterium]
MSKKSKFFADDGWAMWVDGNDTSTIYLNNWLNPHGKSFMDIAIHIRGVNESKSLNMYIPFAVDKSEIEDVSLRFDNESLTRAIFSSMCLIDYKKNECTSELAYNGKTVDVIHISAVDFSVTPVSNGTLLQIPLEAIFEYLHNDEVYLIFRVPHKSISDVFKLRKNVGSLLTKIRDLIMSPIISESYGYSVRINEARLLPKEINTIGSFHRQKLKKAVVTISIGDDYEINDSSCYRIHRLEEELYKDFCPESFDTGSTVMYHWQQTLEENFKGRFNFYLNISRNAISISSFALYLIIIVVVNTVSGILWDLIKMIFGIY